jgi:hypothetical protein
MLPDDGSEALEVTQSPLKEWAVGGKLNFEHGKEKSHGTEPR